MARTWLTVALLVVALAQVGYGAKKKLIMEDLTGAWCGWCPRGPIEMKKFDSAYPGTMISITQHYNDAMQNSFSMELNTLLANTSYPAMAVNRRAKEGMSHASIFAYATEATTTTAPVAVSITHTWDNATRRISGTITARFDAAPVPGVKDTGGLRIGLMIVENNVVGTGTGYDHSNYYNTMPDYPELQGAGATIVGYKHHMVQRDCPLGGLYGTGGIIPKPPVIGAVYSIPFSCTVPAQFPVPSTTYAKVNVVLANLYLVPFVAYNKGQILNAERVVLNTTRVNPDNAGDLRNRVDYSIRPAGSGIRMNVAVAGDYNVTLYSLSGKKTAQLADSYLTASEHSFSLRKGSAVRGTYIVTVRSPDGAMTTHPVNLSR